MTNKVCYDTNVFYNYDAQVGQGHAMEMAGTQILYIKSEVLEYDTTRYFACFEVSVYHSFIMGSIF